MRNVKDRTKASSYRCKTPFTLRGKAFEEGEAVNLSPSEVDAFLAADMIEPGLAKKKKEETDDAGRE